MNVFKFVAVGFLAAGMSSSVFAHHPCHGNSGVHLAAEIIGLVSTVLAPPPPPPVVVSPAPVVVNPAPVVVQQPVPVSGVVMTAPNQSAVVTQTTAVPAVVQQPVVVSQPVVQQPVVVQQPTTVVVQQPVAIPNYGYGWYRGAWVPSYQGWFWYGNAWAWGGGHGPRPVCPGWHPDPRRPVPPRPPHPPHPPRPPHPPCPPRH